MRPGHREINKLWDWTRKDVDDLFKCFSIELYPGQGGSGPSNAYAIYLFCMMDLWGSIFRDKFGDSREASNNVSDFLEKLRNYAPQEYDFSFEFRLNKVADKLRNNLTHNYGLRVIKSNQIDEWLEIQVNGVGLVIFKNASNRIQIDCMRLKNHILIIVEQWLRLNNYI